MNELIQLNTKSEQLTMHKKSDFRCDVTMSKSSQEIARL